MMVSSRVWDIFNICLDRKKYVTVTEGYDDGVNKSVGYIYHFVEIPKNDDIVIVIAGANNDGCNTTVGYI